VVNSVPPGTHVLVTTRLRKVATPLIRALQPDIIVSFSFPYLITPELCAIPRYGAVNLHPSALPAYRGPNPPRGIYEGFPLLGATLHWIAEEYDTGHMLAQHTAPLPANVAPEDIMKLWPPLMMGAFAEGVARAVAGDPGAPQDHRQASYAAAFTEAEHWLTPGDTRQVIQRKCSALNLFSPSAKLQIDDQAYLVARIDPLDDATAAPPGTRSEQSDQGFTLQVADGRVRVQATSL
jgi:methionyl-tRNA formyltransferase